MTKPDFESRRKELVHLSDTELNQRFWTLTKRLVSPLMDLAKRHTTPSIERSVLLRMGFSSIEAKAIVEAVIDCGLMGKGAGHIVYKLAVARNISIREAGQKVITQEDREELSALFVGVAS
jgi:D-ornithine 4,5-aminomutase subunit alpha